MVKHVPNEELFAIPTAAEDLFIIGGKDAFEKRQVQQRRGNTFESFEFVKTS